MKKIQHLAFLIFLVVSVNNVRAQVIYVGIPKDRFDYFASAQRNSNWCWAASLQMIFNYYGINIEQEEIVRRSYGTDPYGNLPNWAGSFQVITANLNNWNIDGSGKQYAVNSSFNWGAPSPSILINELSAQKPVLIGYRSGPSSGHAVVITALSYIMTSYGPQIQSLIVRDPFPTQSNIDNEGRNEYPAMNLASLVQAHWFITIR